MPLNQEERLKRTQSFVQALRGNALNNEKNPLHDHFTKSRKQEMGNYVNENPKAAEVDRNNHIAACENKYWEFVEKNMKEVAGSEERNPSVEPIIKGATASGIHAVIGSVTGGGGSILGSIWSGITGGISNFVMSIPAVGGFLRQVGNYVDGMWNCNKEMSWQRAGEQAEVDAVVARVSSAMQGMVDPAKFAKAYSEALQKPVAATVVSSNAGATTTPNNFNGEPTPGAIPLMGAGQHALC